MTPSHDAPDTGPSSFDDGPAPATLGLSRREMRAAERARAIALGIDEADDAPVEERSPQRDVHTPDAGSGDADGHDAAARDERPGPAGDAPASAAPVEQPAPPRAAPPIGPDTSAILLSGGVLTRRQLRAIREAEEATRQQRGAEHDQPADQDAPSGGSAPAGDAGRTRDDAVDADAAAAADAAPVDDAAPVEDVVPAEDVAPVEDTTPGDDAALTEQAAPAPDASVPPYVRYGRGSRATPRPRAPYGSAYRRPADAPADTSATESEPTASASDAPVTDLPSTDDPAVASASTDAATAPATPSSDTPSAWPFAPIVPSSDAGDRDVDSSGEQPTVPPLASHIPERGEDPRPAPVLEPVPWATAPTPRLEPAFGTRAADAEELDGIDTGDRAPVADPAPAPVSGDIASDAPAASTRAVIPDPSAAPLDASAPFTPPTGHWSVQDQVDDDQPHTGNHFILPSVPHANDMQQALNSTGEIIITGSIDLPRSLGSMGTHPDRFDTADMDRMLEQGDDHDHAHGGSDSEPVRASRAVSTHASTRAVVQPPPRKRFTAPVVAAVTAGGVAVIGAGLVVVAFMTNVF